MKVKVQVLNDEVDEVMPKKTRWHKGSGILGSVSVAHNKYYYWSQECQRTATMYAILADITKNHIDILLQMWDEIRNTGVLYFEDDDDPLYLSIGVTNQWFVYNDVYTVDKIDHGRVHFEKVSK